MHAVSAGICEAQSEVPASACSPADKAGSTTGIAADYQARQIFVGVSAYINGKTGKYSAMHLTKLLQLHGKFVFLALFVPSSLLEMTHLTCFVRYVR